MSINLTKNKAQILDAWTKVSNNEDGYDWALFSYEGRTFELKVEAIGSGGIESVCEEFNDGKIQYAFVRVKDPNTQLIKFILINFQGEAVLDLVHKGTCANHIKDVSRLLKNHLTITATNIDDLDEDTILSKVSKITSEYNFQQRTVPSDEKFKVGTNYERVIPTREINVVKRDEFWRKEEEIEKARVASEQEAKKLANLKIEEERAKREQSEHSKRELMNKDASILTEKKKEIVIAPKPAPPVERDEPARPKAEEMRADRRREAQELIGNRVNTAKAMWQQQAAQNSTPPIKASPPQKPIRKTILPKVEPEPEPEIEEQQPTQNVEVEVTKQIESLKFTDDSHQVDDDDEQFSTIKRSPKTPDKGDNGFIIAADNESVQEPIAVPVEAADKIEIQKQFQQIENEEIEFQKLKALEKQQKELEETQKQLESISQDLQQQQDEVVVEEDVPMLKAVALYDYQAVDDTEISFDPGDIITHIDQIDEGWWQGYSERFGTYGLFPANYVEIIN